jgi:hypothetical protein
MAAALGGLAAAGKAMGLPGGRGSPIGVAEGDRGSASRPYGSLRTRPRWMMFGFGPILARLSL